MTDEWIGHNSILVQFQEKMNPSNMKLSKQMCQRNFIINNCFNLIIFEKKAL
tara:strand:- start:700 stop:855 length:156 start_codon:yes stop_codon:yes gene_type:complete